MINLEEYIRNNRKDLDSEEPSLFHERAFEKKLNGRIHRKDRYLIRYATAIAASVIIFVSASIYIYVKNSEGYTGAIETSQWIEFKEAEQYYSMQTENAVNKLKIFYQFQCKYYSVPVG
ncbi:MAG TPA: hypothetical protein VHO90_04205 [Bacteroidales bacterium]|nr:hypothetical protein [Bacteroidales bacterium]